MLELKVCLVCLTADVKLHSLKEGNLRRDYNLVSGLHTRSENGLPEFLCVFCVAYIRRYVKFRERCQRTHFALQELLQRSKQIKKSHLSSFDKKTFGILPQLSYMVSQRLYYEQVKFQWVKHNRLPVTTGDQIPIAHYSTLTNQDTFVDIAVWNSSDAENIVKSEEDDVNCVNNRGHANNFVEPSTQAIQINTDNNVATSDDYFEESHFDDYTEFEDHNDATEVEEHKENTEIEHHIDNTVTGNCNDVNMIEENNDNLTDTFRRDNEVDGSKLEEEYASIFPISVKEAKAALEVYKMFSNGKYKCDVCHKQYKNEERLTVHSRMHDKHTSGNYHCKLCDYFYKTEFLLQTHMTEKHMYKYVCRKCPEVSFDRTSAKQHYIWSHLQKGQKKNANWYETRPSWLSGKGGKRVKGVVTLRPVRKMKNLPEDFLIYSPIGHEEQYQLVEDRKKTSNYTDSMFKCELCFKGFREVGTYDKHMKKHNPEYSGNLQCDMCKLYFKDQRKLYKHMNISHLFKYSCRLCSFFCVNRGQAHAHYRWHKNVTYPCQYCEKIFKKLSTRLTHIRIKHPSTNICNLCGHSFVSETGLYCHKQIAHSLEEREMSKSVPVNTTDPCYCAECGVYFLNDIAFATHLGSSSKHASVNLSINPGRKHELIHKRENEDVKKRGRPRAGGARSEVVNNGVSTSTNCEVCGKFLVNDVQARKHYEAEHPGTDYLKRYMCDVCGHTTRQYANLMVHMRTHTHEKPYECPHCDRRFSMPSNRDRHLVVHTGEKRYQCQHCNRRFTQSSAVKLHIQTVHLKIPYAPWDKKNRKRRKEVDGTVAPVPTVLTANPGYLPPQHKLLLDTQGDYLNAYISYNDD